MDFKFTARLQTSKYLLWSSGGCAYAACASSQSRRGCSADVLPLRAALPAQGDEMQRLRRRGIVPDDLAYGLPGPPGEPLQYRGADRRISDTKILHGGAHACAHARTGCMYRQPGLSAGDDVRCGRACGRVPGAGGADRVRAAHPCPRRARRRPRAAGRQREQRQRRQKQPQHLQQRQHRRQ